MNTKRIILDCDMGTDDAMAMLLAFGLDRDLEAVTTVGGNCSVDLATLNACYLLELLGRDHVPVFRGEEGSTRPEVKKIIADGGAAAHGEDGLQGQYRPPRKKEPERQSAVDFLHQTLGNAKRGEVVVVATGPLTNIASVLRQDEEAAQKLGQLVVMGGAVRESGNITPSAEFNFYADPESARDVLEVARVTGMPLTLVPLDATHQVYLSDVDLLLKIGRGSPIKEFVYQVAQPYIEFYASVGFTWGCPLHDPLAMGIALYPAFALKSERLDVTVDTDGETPGRSVADLRPTDLPVWRDRAERWRQSTDWANLNVDVVTGVDAVGFKEAFIQAIRSL